MWKSIALVSLGLVMGVLLAPGVQISQAETSFRQECAYVHGGKRIAVTEETLNVAPRFIVPDGWEAKGLFGSTAGFGRGDTKILLCRIPPLSPPR